MTDYKNLVSQAKQMEDQTEVKAGGDFEYTPPAAGRTVGRFIEYIELGSHVEIFDGKPKPAAPMVRLTFELLNPKTNIREIEVDGVKKTVADRISVTLPKKQTEKAKFFKLFKAMAYGRTEITHMAEMLGEAFVIVVTHNVRGEKPNQKTFANIWNDGVWGVHAPRNEDAITGDITDLSKLIKDPISSVRLFLWDIPTKETWDTLFIDGEREVKDDKGNVKKESKNWLQERILSATDFGGSALEQMVSGLSDLPTGSTSGEQSETKSETSSGSASNASTENLAEGAEVDPNDALAALGL